MWPTLFHIPIINLPIRSYGLMLMIGFLGGTWWAARRASRVQANPDFVVNLGFVALISSVVGARIFYVVHYWDAHFAGKSIWAAVNLTAGGLEFYGGFIGAVVAGVAYMKLTGNSMRWYLDIVAPSIMFGMSMARIGCFLNGCCWGGPAPAELPWSVRFPYASPTISRQWEERETTLPAELIHIRDSGWPQVIPRDLVNMEPGDRQRAAVRLRKAQEELKQAKATGASEDQIKKLERKLAFAQKRHENMKDLVQPLNQQLNKFHLTPSEFTDIAHHHRSEPVHPAQLYASMNGLLLAVLLGLYFYRREHHGTVFALLLLLYPAARIMEELVRADNPHDIAGLTASQFVSIVLFLTGVALMILFTRVLPAKSPRAVPYVPPEEEPKPGKKK